MPDLFVSIFNGRRLFMMLKVNVDNSSSNNTATVNIRF